MVSFIDEHREEYGVEPICQQLPIAPSTYYEQKAREADPSRLPNGRFVTPRCARRSSGSGRRTSGSTEPEGLASAEAGGSRRGAVHGGAPDAPDGPRGRHSRPEVQEDHDRGRGGSERPADLVQRDFTADRPNRLWVADLTYVATWVGFVYVAFITDVFSRKIVGWRVSNSLRSDLALDALEQALHARPNLDNLVHHNDRGVQYLSIRYTERLAEAGIEPSVGSVGDSYDNALAETIFGLYKTEVIRRNGPWRNIEEVEFATLEWVDWFNNRRLFEPIGNIPPVEFEALYYERQETPAMGVGLT